MSSPSRRTVLLVGSSGVGLAALAACGSSGSDGTGSTASGSGAGSSPSSTASSSPSSAPSSSTASSGSSSAAASDGLIALADVPVGGGVAVQGKDGKGLIVTQPTKGTVRAMSSKCTHMGCTVAPKGGELDCPCHGSRYDLTGKVLKGPAPAPLASVSVSVVGGQVVQA